MDFLNDHLYTKNKQFKSLGVFFIWEYVTRCDRSHKSNKSMQKAYHNQKLYTCTTIVEDNHSSFWNMQHSDSFSRYWIYMRCFQLHKVKNTSGSVKN